jgi:hypothetical protein
LEIFEKDCLVRLGTCIAPRGIMQENGNALNFKVEYQENVVEADVPFGSIKVISLNSQSTAKIILSPAKNLDVGTGPGRRLEASVEGGVVGLILDCRGRPLQIPEEPASRRDKLLDWYQALNAYPEAVYERIRHGKVKEAN